VYASATGSRFEHSLGVAYLAGKWMQHFRETNRKLKITDHDVFLCEIAGLVHDLGHNCLSHAFESSFKSKNGKFEHESMSVACFKYLMHENNNQRMKLMKLTEEDIDIVCRMIKSDPPPNTDRAFMYQIVANYKTGIDVDRFDYMKRDSAMAGLPLRFDAERIMKMSRIINGNIAFRDKEAYNVVEMYESRYKLYKQLYNHPVSKAAELMCMDSLSLVDEQLNISKWSSDPSTYHLVSDSMIGSIARLNPLDSDGKQIAEIVRAQKIMRRLQYRDMYSLIKEIYTTKTNTEEAKEEVFEQHPTLKEFYNKHQSDITVCMVVRKHNSALDEKHPIEYVHFFSKDDYEKSFHLPTEKISNMISKTCVERYLLFFWKPSLKDMTRKEKKDLDACKLSLKSRHAVVEADTEVVSPTKEKITINFDGKRTRNIEEISECPKRRKIESPSSSDEESE
jgi:HD superfamily phosphohydrolase